jgi:hypothetical protein
MRLAYWVMVGKREGILSFGRYRRGKDNIKIGLRKIG